MELSTFVLLVMACGLRVGADGTNHRYKEGDHVPLFANKVGPFHNPSETYRYYDLPFCSPEHVTEKTEALGEVLNGDRLVDAPYELNFLEDQQSKSLCKKTCQKKMLQSSDMLYQRTITLKCIMMICLYGVSWARSRGSRLIRAKTSTFSLNTFTSISFTMMIGS
ncbi:unnamed protein product [Musa banksii]